jgi:hypothetical protein
VDIIAFPHGSADVAEISKLSFTATYLATSKPVNQLLHGQQHKTEQNQDRLEMTLKGDDSRI